MSRRTNERFKKRRKPIIALICEGRNQTEKLYFNHFNKRDNSFNLKIFSCEATDPKSMAKKAKEIISDLQLDNDIGDRVFCLVDLDLSNIQLRKVEEEKSKPKHKKCKVEFILSNPCFEVWFLFYFTKYPKVETSSQNVKEQLKNYIPQYKESMDVVKVCNLEEIFLRALDNAELYNIHFNRDKIILDRNPYTEMPDLLEILLNPKNFEKMKTN